MNTNKFCLSLVSVLLAASLSATAQGFNDNFSTSQGWVGGQASATSGNNTGKGWTTNDPFAALPDRGDTSAIAYVGGITPGGSGSGNNSLLFGGMGVGDGVFPGRPDPELVRTFTPVVTDGSNPYVRFQSDFFIQTSADESFPAFDKFGFDLRNSSGTSIAKFTFNPGTVDPVTPPITNSGLRFQWTKDGSIQTTGGSGLTSNWDISYGQKYRIQVDLSASAFTARMLTLNSSNVVTGTTVFVNNGAVSATTSGLDFSRLGLTWNLANSTNTDELYDNAGSNFILLNNASAVAVPEPSTIALGLIGLGGLLAYRRFRKQA